MIISSFFTFSVALYKPVSQLSLRGREEPGDMAILLSLLEVEQTGQIVSSSFSRSATWQTRVLVSLRNDHQDRGVQYFYIKSQIFECIVQCRRPQSIQVSTISKRLTMFHVLVLGQYFCSASQ